MRFRCIVIITAMMILIQGANAISIRNVTTDTVIGFDDFESNTAASSAAWRDLSGDYDPDHAAVGLWSCFESYERTIQVTNYAVPGAAYKGNNYLRIRREGNYPLAKLIVTEQTTTDDEINVKMMVNMSKNDDFAGDIHLYGRNSSGVEQEVIVVSFMDYARIMSHDGSRYNDTGLRYNANEWAILEINWRIGADTFCVTYRGKTAADVAVRNTDIVSFTAVGLGDTLSPTTCYDAVPEPESCTDVKNWYWLTIPEADINRDCEIDFCDFVLLATNWLECNDPIDSINCTFNWQ